MSKSNMFEDMKIRQKAKDISVQLYRDFRSNKDFGFRDQIQRAAVSVANNIAEGFERRTNNELKYFLYVAKGSCGEVRNMLHIGYELEYISEEKYKKYLAESLSLSKMIYAFIIKL